MKLTKEEMWNIRQQINVFFRQELGEDDGGLVAAMLLGEKSGLNEEELFLTNGFKTIFAKELVSLILNWFQNQVIV